MLCHLQTLIPKTEKHEKGSFIQEQGTLLNIIVCTVSHSAVSDSVTPRTVAHQAPLPMKFSRQEYWSGLPFPPPADLPDLEIELASLASFALAGRFFTTEPLGKPNTKVT